jgi:hypothetical protein
MKISHNGFSFDPQAVSVRLAAEAGRVGITTRAQAIAAWNGMTPNARVMFLGKLFLGACTFPGDPPRASPYQTGAAPTVPGPGE